MPTEPTYTMFLSNDRGRTRIVARGVDAGRAMAIGLNHGQTRPTKVVCRNLPTHRIYDIARHQPGLAPETLMTVEIPRTSDEIRDAFGEILTDAEFARHRAH